jgi:Helix-turn-helix
MKATVETERRFVLLGSQRVLFRQPLPPRVFVCHDRSEVEAAVSHPAKRATWISFSRQFTDILLENAVTARTGHRGGHLLTLTPPRAESIPALLGLFHPVFGLVEGFRWLPEEELVEAIARDDAAERFIGGYVDPKGKALTLLRGDLETVVAPLSIFQRSGEGTEPDFARLRLTDYGRTVALGDYEASADAILYELDPQYRHRLKKRRRQDERTFGAALMRLRKQRRLKRSDFGHVSAKEIARIERNEITKPHARTLEAIAARLGVRVDEIADY